MIHLVYNKLTHYFGEHVQLSPSVTTQEKSDSSYNSEYPGVFRLGLGVHGSWGNPVFLTQGRQKSTTHQERQEATQRPSLVLQKNKQTLIFI